MEDTKLYYKATNIDVRVGDKILYKSWWLFNKQATVVYVPGQSKIHQNIGDDQWVIELNDSKELITMGYFPEMGEVISEKIIFVSRGVTDSIQEHEEIN
jgi:hypothetical protein